jgi:hypothetical protein
LIEARDLFALVLHLLFHQSSLFLSRDPSQPKQVIDRVFRSMKPRKRVARRQLKIAEFAVCESVRHQRISIGRDPCGKSHAHFFHCFIH